MSPVLRLSELNIPLQGNPEWALHRLLEERISLDLITSFLIAYRRPESIPNPLQREISYLHQLSENQAQLSLRHAAPHALMKTNCCHEIKESITDCSEGG